MVRQTGGRPQLIDNVEVQARADSTGGSWVVKLGAEGLRVLLDTIDSRPQAVRDTLQAAAVCSDGGCTEPELVARVTGRAYELVEQLLDEERRRGAILISQASSYCFQHDNWIDVLISSCPPARLRALHAQCLALLRDDSTANPRKLVQHATAAGAVFVSTEELARLASQAADLDMADYAFSTAAPMYEVAARHAVGADQVDLLVKQSDALRFSGRWREARAVLQRAASLARRLEIPGPEAIALVHLERLTWTYGLDERELTQQLRDVMTRLAPDETVLLAQVQAVLAMRLGIVPRQHENEQADLARAALRQLSSITDRLARADIILGIRGGLIDSTSPEVLLDYDAQIMDLGLETHSAFHIGEALASRIVDLIRAGRLSEVPSAIRDHREFAGRSRAATVIYLQALVDAMLALARGEFQAARRYTDEAWKLSMDWGGSAAHEALMAQAGWLLYETGQVDGLADFLTGLPEQQVSSLNEEVWALGAGLIHAENDQAEPAIRILRDVCSHTNDLKGLPRGPSRIGILATAAMLLGHPLLFDAIPPGEADRVGTGIAELLADHPDMFVLAGWPAVLLGSKHRFIGLAYLAARQPEMAARHLTHAVDENAAFAVLHVRAQFDLARALIRQPESYAQGLTEMKRVQQKAAEIKMQHLTVQAAAELNRHARQGQ